MKPLFAALFMLVFHPAVLCAQFTDNFETDSLSGWIQCPEERWGLSANNPLSGTVSLRHVFNNTVSATDIIYRPLRELHPQENNITWRFLLKHGYNPSGSNKWGVVLMANAPATEWRSGGTYQAYVIGVNQGSNTDDTLSLYAVWNNTFTNIGKTTINWEKDIKTTGTGAVEVTRTYDGQWTIRAAVTNHFDALDTVARPVVHAAYTAAQYFGLRYTYTAAADRLLWWDEVSVQWEQAELPPPPPPPYEPAFGDIVFNEIMAKADPSNGLPEVQYIELYNRSEHDIILEGWKINYNTTVGNVGTTSIPAKSCLILCASAQTATMAAYGKVATLTNISSLTKIGKTLLLKNAAGDIMARVAYSDTWIVDEAKRDGGWSLEKIDPDNLSESAGNWAASVAAEGGTPGKVNSVYAPHPDEEPPFVAALQRLDEHHLLLEMNEWFNVTNALQPLSYHINNAIGQPAEITYDPTQPLQLMLRFDKAFEQGIVYQLSLQSPFCDMAGNTPTDTTYAFADLRSPQPGDVVINEVLFHPFTGGADFVELYNLSDHVFDTRQLKLANRDKTGEVATITPCPQQHYFNPRDYTVFATTLDALRSFYTVPFPGKVMPFSSLPSYPNAEGCVVLLSAEDVIVDEFCYTEKMHSAFISDPQGVSLERVNPAAATGEASNWQSAARTAGWATPTYKNSQFNDEKTVHNAMFSLSSEVFSPDGDGYQDVLYIDYDLPGPDYMACITIYDVQGRPVRNLENNTLLGVSGRLSWDGAGDNRQRVSSGIYVIFIRAFDERGNLKTAKIPCVVALR